MVVTPSGAAGHAAVGHVTEELRTGHVPAPIPRLYTEEEIVGDWDQLKNIGSVIDKAVQVKCWQKAIIGPF